jgi:hypothetical protein
VPNCGSGTVSVLLGKGDGTLFPQKQYPVHGSCPGAAEVADMNGDSIADITTASDISGTVSVLLGKGDGTFQLPPLVAKVPGDAFDVVVRDFNGDTFPDAATANYENPSHVYILLNDGGGRLSYAGSYLTGIESIVLAGGDFNNDGAVDLAVANQFSDSLSVLLGNGDGTFKPKVDYPTEGDFANGISTADLDNDGNVDVVVSNSRTNTIAVFKGKGDGTFPAPALYRVRRGPTGSSAADFDQDGYLDLAVSCQGVGLQAGVVAALLNNQQGGFVTHSTYAMPATFFVTSGDLNGDGYPDVIATNPEYGRITVLINDRRWDAPVPPVPLTVEGMLRTYDQDHPLSATPRVPNPLHGTFDVERSFEAPVDYEKTAKVRGPRKGTKPGDSTPIREIIVEDKIQFDDLFNQADNAFTWFPGTVPETGQRELFQ